MIVFRLALNEIGRFAARKLTRLALLALLIIPLLYSSLYLYANSDPYKNLGNVPVAVVNNDKGMSPDAAASTGGAVSADSATAALPKNMGDQLVENLMKNKSFKWMKADADEVKQGVFDGTYSFALIIGEDFTKNIERLSKFDAVRTEMTLMLNDANSYVLHEIAEQAEFRVAAEVAQEISKEVVILQLEGIAEIRAQLAKAAAGAGELADGLKSASAGAEKLDAGVSEFADALLQLKNGLDELNSSVKALPPALKQLKAGSAKLKSGLDQVDAVTDKIGGYENKANRIWNDIDADLIKLVNASDLPKVIKKDLLKGLGDVDKAIGSIHSSIREYVSAIDQLDAGAGQLDAGISTLQTSSKKLVAGIKKLDKGAREMQSKFSEIVTGVAELSNGLKKLTDGADELGSKLESGVNSLPDLTDAQRKKFAEVVADPVEFKTTTMDAAGSYAIGLAPFFMALAGWIGIYILFILMAPISTRALISNVAPWKVALGGWLPPASIGVLQMLVMFIALHFIVALSPVYTLLTLLFLFLMVLTYLTIVHFLVTALGKVGLFIGLVLMVIQLTSAGGTFPWQTLPFIDQLFYKALPMSHAVDALRNLIYGGSLDIALQKSLVLLAYLAVFAVCEVLVVRARRRWSVKTLFPAI
jgi:putative membrane protein